MDEKTFTDEDYFRGIVLYGLNAATYKMGLASTLLSAAKEEKTVLSWLELSERYFDVYLNRLETSSMPQQGNAARLTVMERIVGAFQNGEINREQAIERVSASAFEDVVPRFQTIGTDKSIVLNYFYDFEFSKKLTLKDSLLLVAERESEKLESEVEARWSLLEGAFSINQENFELSNDAREVYLKGGGTRKPLTKNIPFLSGYQGGVCFYCGESLCGSIHVDHVLPRQVVNHDEVWNLVLSHPDCNLLKSDKLVGPHFMRKLIARNENIMGSNHPWKSKISSALGNTPSKRAFTLLAHYERVKIVLGAYYWGGTPGYNPETDPFFRRLITRLNNR